MIKKILLFTVIALGVVACSKDDNNTPTPDKESGDDTIQVPTKDKLEGVWLGTYEIVAEKPEKQNRLIELLRERDEQLKILGEKDFTKARAVFDHNHARFYYSDNSVIDAFDYVIKHNQLIDKEKAETVVTFSLEGEGEGSKLTGEFVKYKYDDITDTEAMTKENLEGVKDFFDLKEKYTYKYKRKFTLTKKL